MLCCQAADTFTEKMPYLVSLTKEQRVSMLKLSAKSTDFVTRLLPIAKANAQYLPPAFDMTEWGKDVELFQALRELLDTLNPLLEKMDDTLMVVGSEAYAGALTAYQYLKAANKGGDLDDLLDDLGKRFARKSKAVPTPQPAETPK
jgi:hypothetical protein